MSQNQRRGRGGNQSREVSISKALSLLLRHAAEKEGLKLDSQGYANMADVVRRALKPEHTYNKGDAKHLPFESVGMEETQIA